MQRRGRSDDDVGAAHCVFRRHGRRAVLLGKALGVLRRAAPHPHLVDRPYPLQRLEMGRRLHAAAEQRQDMRIRSREVPGRRRRYRGGAHLGNEAAVHHRQRLAGLGAEQQHHRHVGRQGGAGIARIEADQLRPHCRLGDGRHDAEISPALLDRQHVAHRLQHTAGRKWRQRRLHRRDQRIPVQHLPDRRLIEMHDHRLFSGPIQASSSTTLGKTLPRQRGREECGLLAAGGIQLPSR